MGGQGDPPAWLRDVPPVRLLLSWDNLAGHHTPALGAWLVARGGWPLPTPWGGSWLNLAASSPPILVRRARDGQQPTTGQEIRTWLTDPVAGWTADPTPFLWGGPRAARRGRARERHHALGGSGGDTRRPLPRRRPDRLLSPPLNGHAYAD